ncbi:transglycosylase SLT domain-containing protein [Nocardia sp. ET3-3]|uniref:Transglycosylase SLT domain-containing protein n=1 Tax=Nocardia terrae TaxID=2675851 RepID=A0A7K1V6R4_9NOCA|nr:bifunctional lytic transglycosylase/C40 family peptidase [Nocardia terrae]MVU82335.1 transglycosylase SLT domain-containing protein [Nocardia terrae]
MLARVLAAGGVSVVFTSVVIAAVVTTVTVANQTNSTAPNAGVGSAPSQEAVSDIPPYMLVLYQRAATACPGLDWSVLAGIGKVETDHGRSTLPGVSSGENFAGAAGPMQFLAPTFDSVTSRHPMPADGASPPSRYNPVDAVYAAAYYLCDSGAPEDVYSAIFTYNHADWYVHEVLDQAAAYRSQTPTGPGDCGRVHGGDRASVVLAFACAQLGQPYVWGGDGPQVNGGWDCSGLTKAAYASIGLTLPRTAAEQYRSGPIISESALRPGDLVFYGTTDNIHHVGLYLGNSKIVNAPTFGIPVRVQDLHYPGDDYFGATSPLTASSAVSGDSAQ